MDYGSAMEKVPYAGSECILDREPIFGGAIADRLYLFLRRRSMKEIEKAFHDGDLKEGQMIRVYSAPFSGERLSQTGRVVSAKTKNGFPYVRLEDEKGGVIEPCFRAWEPVPPSRPAFDSSYKSPKSLLS